MKNCQMGTQLNSKSKNMLYMKNKSEFCNKKLISEHQIKGIKTCKYREGESEVKLR